MKSLRLTARELVRKAWWCGRAVTAALVAEIGLRLLPLATTARLMGVPLDLGRGDPEPGPPTHPDASVAMAAAATSWVLRRWPPGDTCLRRALVAGHLLRHHRARLRLGAACAGEGLAGHAWIELGDGQTLGYASGVVPFTAQDR